MAATRSPGARLARVGHWAAGASESQILAGVQWAAGAAGNSTASISALVTRPSLTRIVRERLLEPGADVFHLLFD